MFEPDTVTVGEPETVPVYELVGTEKITTPEPPVDPVTAHPPPPPPPVLAVPFTPVL